ncbi:unnamed protein product [Linum tenue]|uniref:Uncharacterized protein n=1 Tax=Linum tenue TaxID=586396 RepID=A0AAV0RWR2_9ROSI|nr:unnamed protein product [Linum tenue]
MAKADTLLQLS